MTQAAVSYQIKLLEERLRSKLFLRQKGGLLLTDVGSRIAPLVSGSFDTLEQAFSSALAEDDQTLTVNTTHSFAAYWLAPRIGSFQILQPQLAVRLRSDDRYVDFAAEDEDVVIRNGSGNWPGLCSHLLMGVHIQPFASPDFITRHGPFEGPNDLKGVPRLSPDEWWWRFWFTSVGDVETGEVASSGLRFDSQAMDATAALAGHGIAILNREMWRREIKDGCLVPVGPYAVTQTSYWLAYPEYRRQSIKVRAFRNWIESEVALSAADSHVEG